MAQSKAAKPGGSSSKQQRRSGAATSKEPREVQVPPSVPDDWEFEEKKETPGEPGVQDPWIGDDDPWKQWKSSQMKSEACGESGGKKPTWEDFESFLQWWQSHSSVESAETRSAPPSMDASMAQGGDSTAKGRATTRRQHKTSWVGGEAYQSHQQPRGQGDRPRRPPPGPPDLPDGDGGDEKGRREKGRREKGRREKGRREKGRRRGGDDRKPGSDPPDDDDPGTSGDEDEDAEESPTESSVGTSELRSMLQRRMKQTERPKSSLGSVRVEDFYGDRGKYQSWKRVVCAQKQLYQLAGSELAMLVYISCKKEARDVLDQMTIDEMVAAGGLERMWALLDEAYQETSEEHFERLEAEFNNYRRAPGQSIPSYLNQIKRLKMEYSREDPLTKMSDRAWAQRILIRAALTKRERMDVFFSAGGCYSPKEIEKALRHRCQKIHEEERRLPQPTRRPFRSSTSRASSGRSSTTRSSSTSWRTRSKGGQGSYMAAVEEEENPEDCDEEDLEADPEAFEAYIQENEEKEAAEEDDEAQEASDGEVITAEELKEAWAAGWRAKDQVNEKRKGRNFRNPALKSSFGREKPDARKQSTTCSSCGMKGHWKGDPECPKVKNGEDKPFTPKPKSAKGVHFVSVQKAAEERPVHAVAAVESSKNGLKVHEVNFTFMVGGSHKKEKKHRGDGKQITCPQCSRVMDETARFCSGCGMSMAPHPMRDHEKRQWKLVDYESSSDGDGSFAQVEEPGRSSAAPAPKMMAGGVCAHCGRAGHKRHQCPEVIGGYPYDPSGAREALEALPYMSKDEKKELARRLQREEENDQRPIRPPKGTTSVAPGREKTTLQPPTEEMPAAVKTRRLEEFRRALYDERVDRKGRLIPSAAAGVPDQEQRECPHPWNRLRWTANGQGHYARCRSCDLKNVLGSFMTIEQDYLPKGGVLAIADSGCRTAVGGRDWHERFQQRLKMMGISWEELEESEWFKFGAGDAMQSTKAFLYPVGIHRKCSYLRMSQVDGDAADCPGLVGPSDMSRWKVVFRFETKEVDAMGVTRPMVLTNTRHPGLDLLDFGKDMKFDTEGLKTLREQLIRNPNLFAFVTQEEQRILTVGTTVMVSKLMKLKIRSIQRTRQVKEDQICGSWLKI